MNAIGWTEKRCLKYLFPLIISISFAMDVFVPAIPVMGQFFKTNGTVMQASLYVFMLTVALGQLFVGPLADHYGRRRITLGAALLFFVGSILSSLAPTVSMLIIARMIQAAGACGTYVLCFIIIRDNFPTTVCARLFSILCGINAMVASTAPVIGGLLLDITHDWHSGFYFLTILGLIMSWLAYRTIPDYAYPKPVSSDVTIINTTKTIWSHFDFRQYTLIASVSLLGLYLFCALSPGILMSKLHLTATQYGLWFGLNAMTAFLTNLVAARLTYSMPLERMVRWGLFWMIFSCLLMISFNFNTMSTVSFMLPMLSLTIGIGLSMGPATALALNDFKMNAGTATALLGACQFGLSGFIGIVTAQWTPEPIVLALPVLCLSLFAILKMRPTGSNVLIPKNSNDYP